MAVKRREQALQDYKRLQSKVEKYEEKEKTGPILAKLHQVCAKLGQKGIQSSVTVRGDLQLLRRWVIIYHLGIYFTKVQGLVKRGYKGTSGGDSNISGGLTKYHP